MPDIIEKYLREMGEKNKGGDGNVVALAVVGGKILRRHHTDMCYQHKTRTMAVLKAVILRKFSIYKHHSDLSS